jgi:Ca2+-binding EF-hand superfamily protein
MTSVSSKDPLAAMLDNAFTKFDRNRDGRLDREEFQTFDELLTPGLPTDPSGRPLVDEQAVMDHNGDGDVTREEMQTTTVLMPADLTDPTLGKMWDYLSSLKNNPEALRAAAILADEEDVAA